MTVAEIVEMLRARHPTRHGEWVFLTEVRTGTGWDPGLGERYFDAFAMNLWPSKAFCRVGYEIKVQRSDWLRELRDPLKGVQGRLLCHQFWYALGPGVLEPEDWRQLGDSRKLGLLVVEDGRLVEKQRPRPDRMPWPMPEGFVASLLRNAAKLPEVL